MNQRMVRTLMFVGAAVVCLGGAIATSIATRPAKLDDAALVGEEFFPDFQDPTKASSLRVAAYDKDTARVNLFNVEFNNGLWRIPSHHNYPADGEDQLAKTAASVVGIKRGLYAGKTPEDQKRMGVLDPLDESITGTEGRGARITLSEGGKALVDLIVGNKVEETGNIYYVRKADENRVYRAELTGLKVSTKFADWIEPDLLKLDPSKLVQMVIDRYRIDEQRGSLVQGDISLLTKDTTKTPAVWELDGLDPETEKIKTVTVNQMSSSLDNLKIVGVREKPAGLVAALKGEDGAGLNQIEQIRMQQAGYFLTPDGQLVSNEGEILAGTNEGVRYTLRFGEVISGSDVDIEIGKDVGEAAATEGDEAGEGAESEEDADEDADEDSSVKKNRYVFITATFDEKLLGDRPKAPVKPVPPEAQPAESEDASDAAEAESDSQDPVTEGEQSGDDADSAEPATDSDAADETTESATDGDAAEPAETPDPQKVYEDALKKYEADLAAYEAENKQFDEKVAEGRKLAKELNDRFAPWYYVISADLFQKLKVDRSELVEAVTPETETPTSDATTTPAELTAEPEAAAEENSTEPKEEPAADAPEKGEDAPSAESTPEGDTQPANPTDGDTATDDSSADGSPKSSENPVGSASDAGDPTAPEDQ